MAGIIPKGALTHHQLKLAVVLPNGSRALSEEDEGTEENPRQSGGRRCPFSAQFILSQRGDKTARKENVLFGENILDKSAFVM